MEINDLHKAMLNFQELEQNRQWTPQEPREISRNIMKINDLRKAFPANQRVTRPQFCFTTKSTKRTKV